MLNSINIVGRLTRSIELKTSANGKEFCSFSIAHQKNNKNANGEYEVDFINCVAFNQTAVFIDKYFSKGDLIMITGSLNIKSYVNKDGVKQITPEIVVKEAFFGNSKKSDNKAETLSENSFSNGIFEEEDLPF